jgi:hypothetical protein
MNTNTKTNTPYACPDIQSQIQNLQIDKKRTPEETDALILAIQKIIDSAKASLRRDKEEMRIARARGKWRDAFLEVALETQGETIIEE